MAKTDVRDAYRNVPVCPSQWFLLGASIVSEEGDRQYYFDTVLGFGLRSSARIFNDLGDFVARVAEARGVTVPWHCLDDFATVGAPNSTECHANLRIVEQALTDAGFPIKAEKREGPATVITLLGWVINSLDLTAAIPKEKHEAILTELKQVHGKRRVVKRQLLSLLGRLNFVCRFIRAGRCFTRRLIDAACQTQKLHHRVPLTEAARMDIDWWIEFLRDFSGTALLSTSRVFSADDLKLFTDASDSGYGATYDDQWILSEVKGAQAAWSINIKEMYALGLAVATWAPEWQGKRVQFCCDNCAVVFVVNKGSSKNGLLASLVRGLHLTAADYCVEITARHIPGASNSAADALSRGKIQLFRSLNPHARTVMTHPKAPRFA